MSNLLGDKSVGSIVKIKENGIAANYIVVHKGKPSNLYDESCNGVWLLRETALDPRAWNDTYNNDYEASDIHAWLNNTFYNTIDSKIRDAIIQVKIPFKKGVGNASTPVQTGASGLACKVFLLSGYEVGLTTSDRKYLPVDGAKLSYFLNGNTDATAKSKRIAYNSAGNAVYWWLRSAYTNSTTLAWFVNTAGTLYNYSTYYTGHAPRPALVLPSSLIVDSDDTSGYESRKFTIAVDFDGTLCENRFPDIGAPKSLVIEYIKLQQLTGARIILHTCRENGTKRALLDEALQFCKEQGIELYAVNENPDNTYGEKFGVEGAGRKVYADLYIDDKAMNTAQAEMLMQTHFKAVQAHLKADKPVDDHSDKRG